MDEQYFPYHLVSASYGLLYASDLRIVEETRLGLVGEGQNGIRRGRGILFDFILNIPMTKGHVVQRLTELSEQQKQVKD